MAAHNRVVPLLFILYKSIKSVDVVMIYWNKDVHLSELCIQLIT